MAAEEPKGHQRVAAFLLSLERDAAARVLKTLDPGVVAAVARAMVELSPELGVPSSIDDLWRAVSKALNSPKTITACKEDKLLELFANSYGAKRAKEIVDDLSAKRRMERPFRAIEGYSAGLIFRALKTESAAGKALVLSNLEPSVSADVIKWLDDEEALDVVGRMATLDTPPNITLQVVASGLEETLSQLAEAPPEPDPSERLKSVAELLSYTPPNIEKGVIEAMSEADADMATELREMMFTWEDISTIDKRSMQKILGSVDTKTLSVALKACSPEIEENVLGNLSQRVRDMVAEERDLVGAVPRSEVDSAREEIMRNIRAMIEAGEFSPSRKGEELVS